MLQGLAIKSKNRDLKLDRHKRGQAFRPGQGMVNRFTMAQSTVAIRHWGPPAIVTLVAMAALRPLTAGAAARPARPATPLAAIAPPEAGEPVRAIVSITSQQAA